MATYQFSALADGQAISFNPGADILNFDQTDIAALNVRPAAEASDVRITVVDWPHSGKDVLLLDCSDLTTGDSNGNG